MKPISPLRFDALAGYAREPLSFVYGEEVRYFEHGGERALGLLLRDRADRDFGGLVFARDRRHKFRSVSTTGFCNSRRWAEVELRREMEAIAALPDSEYYQGDERGKPVDFLTPVVPAQRLNPNFVRLREHEFFSPARGIIEEMMRWYEDADGNFVQQFQTTGFDARIWELYLFASFREMFYTIERTQPVPDFACVNPGAKFFVEAVTVNPTQDSAGIVVPEPDIATPGQFDAYRLHYMPIKFGSSLTSKLSKRYWELPHVAGNPLLFAIQDFSAPQSMLRSRSAFETYVYGYCHDWERDAQGTLRILPRRVKTHRWGLKEIPSGFFDRQMPKTCQRFFFRTAGRFRNSIAWAFSPALGLLACASSGSDLSSTTILMPRSQNRFGVWSMIRIMKRAGERVSMFGTTPARSTRSILLHCPVQPIIGFWPTVRSKA